MNKEFKISLIDQKRKLQTEFKGLKECMSYKDEKTGVFLSQAMIVMEYADDYREGLIETMKEFGETEYMHRELDQVSYIFSVLSKCLDRFKEDIEKYVPDMERE